MKISALDDLDGTAVDWWFMYKLPHHAKPPKGKHGKRSTGQEYLYFDAKTKGPLALSPNPQILKAGALHNTLQQFYQAKANEDPSVGWILYNDEQPWEDADDDERKGHTKGMLLFDVKTDTALWLLHSWPKFPALDPADEPAYNYGQTFLCVTLPDVATVNLIAQQMCHEQEPQVYSSHIPDDVKNITYLHKLATDVDVHETEPPCDVPFHSRAGRKFRLLAKNRHQHDDFWIDVVGPRLKADLQVETWRRGTVPTTEGADGESDVQDVLYINLESLNVDYEWHYTKDHAKWASSLKNNWICVADINRQTSQEKRGGGAICFQHPQLWQSLSKIEQYKA